VRIEVTDGETGAAAGAPIEVTLAPLGWRQLDGLLATAGTRQGWVKVTKISGSGRFLAYGVVNDGARPGEGTGDGSVVTMRGVE
jgi:hypothetical protein